jgi:GNAT superfamily N-acetyltransferase
MTASTFCETGPDCVQLRDGSTVSIRPVRAGDATLLAEGFSRLSVTSRWLRFMMAKPTLTAAEVRYFTDVDQHEHVALGAIDVVDGRGVGVVRYVRDRAHRTTAEFALTVIDEWHRRGLGLELMKRLVERAERNSVDALIGLVAAENTAMIKLLRKLDADVELVSSEDRVLTFQIKLRTRPRRLWPV